MHDDGIVAAELSLSLARVSVSFLDGPTSVGGSSYDHLYRAFSFGSGVEIGGECQH